MALGAGAPAVLWMVLRDAIFMVLAGAALGIPAVLILDPLHTESMLFGVKAQDPGHTSDWPPCCFWQSP